VAGDIHTMGTSTLTLKEDTGLREKIRRIALLNAVLHDGKAQVQPVLGKLLAEHPHLRAKVKEVTPIIAGVVEEVNRLSPIEQRELIRGILPEAPAKEKVKEKVKEKGLPPLPKAEKYGRIVTRFSPNPDFVLHLGSARAITLSHEYAQMYKGLFYLRFEDTDPRLKKSALQFYDAIREDLTWLGCKWDAEFIQTDRFPTYYEHAERLLREGNAYVCTCQREEFRERIARKEPCPCRSLPPDEHVARWGRMLDGTYREGEAVVRIKTDLHHPNPAVRDWPALRIIDTERHPHPRVGSRYRVWPLYNFANGIDDHLMGVTHIIRGKEHLTNQVRQEYMYRHFSWEYPEAIHYGRLKITGASLSKSKILQGLRKGLYEGWDDPRLATLAALRRRGIVPEAIRLLMIDVGPKAADAVLSWENLYAHNRKVIDPIANRYFFVPNPRKIVVKNLQRNLTAQIPLHPDHPERGFRRFEIEPKDGEAPFCISSKDAETLKQGGKVRFMELFNLQIEAIKEGQIEALFHSQSYQEARKLGIPLIHWIPFNTGVASEVVMPDASIAKGVAEEACKELRHGEIVQLERFGFVRVESLGEKLTAYFAHR